MNNLSSKILTVLSWFWGVMFILAGFGGLLQEGVIVGVLMIIGGVLLLPPTKRFILSKQPKLTKGKVSILATIFILISFSNTSPPVEETLNQEPQMLIAEPLNNKEAIEDKNNTLIEKETSNSNDETILSENTVIAENESNSNKNSSNESSSLTIDKNEVDSTDNINVNDKSQLSAETEPLTEPLPITQKEPQIVETPTVEEVSEPEEIIIEKPVETNNCVGLPSTCGAMANCQQARLALECGNRRLDKDRDGIPCESICN